MAKTAVSQWDTTANNNTDIDSVDIDENCAPSGMNNAVREVMAQIATAMTTGALVGIGHLAKSGAYTVLAADRGKCIDCSAALTLTLTAAATMQAGWMCYVKADGGAVTIDPNASETIEGSATLTVEDGTTAVIYTDATSWYVAATIASSIVSTATKSISDSDSPYTLLAADEGKIITIDSSAGDVTVNLLAAATAGDGFQVSFKRIAGDSNTITLDGNSTETIDGATTLTIDYDDDVVGLRCDGSNWEVDRGHFSIPAFARSLLEASSAATAKTTLDIGVATINAQTGTSYTLVLTDEGKEVTMSNASANTLTIPPNSSVAFDVGTIINVTQLGAGTTTITGDTGVTVNGVSTGSADITTQYKAATLLKTATNTWLLQGSVGAVS
ncbi:MAG: hypothetical protein GY807_20500 [Gammaproteobacteria bacterium]|nr:hypothetical protein [Gammaproteobacteria bacterium]